MSAIAVIIGINDYKFAPLSSAVRDALAFRDALVELDLVGSSEVSLLTDPPQPGGSPATLKSINKVLREVYDNGSRLDRLYLFFAGHGVSGYVDASHSNTQTLMIPSDISDPAENPNLLINFDDFRQRLEHAGPAQQLLLFDACRDLAFDAHPVNLPKISWEASRNPATKNIAQATLFAVSPGGKALGSVDGMGVMTEHLIDALHGTGVALDWSEDYNAHVLTPESIARYVRARIERATEGHLQWRQQIMVPELRDVGGPFEPIRVIADPPPANLTLVYEPPQAHAQTTVTLTLRGQPVEVPRWPPSVPLHPVAAGLHSYRIWARNPTSQVYAEPERIDLRELQTATIRVGDRPSKALLGPAPGTAFVSGEVRSPTRGPSDELAHVHASSIETGTAIELVGTDPPYNRWEQRGQFSEQVPPGSYSMRFRQGTEVYSEVFLDLVAGEHAQVSPGGARSPLLSEAGLPDHDGSVYVSSTAGFVRSGTLATVLTLLGLVPFDPAGSLRTQFNALVPSDTAVAYGELPVRVVIAVEGSGWPVGPHEVAERLTCELISSNGDAVRVALTPIARGSDGWARVVQATARAPGRNFTVRIRSSWAGTIDIVAAALAGRVTVVALTLTPDGRVELAQHLLRVPGRHYDEPTPDIEYDRLIRELVLGQHLYASGELLQLSGRTPGTRDDSLLARLEDLLYAKWTDPILGCMAYLALAEASTTSDLRLKVGLGEAAGNIFRWFGDLIDARVIAAHADVPGAPPLARALGPGETPVLAQSLRLLAATPGEHQDAYKRWLHSVSPTSPWTLVLRNEAGVAFGNERAGVVY